MKTICKIGIICALLAAAYAGPAEAGVRRAKREPSYQRPSFVYNGFERHEVHYLYSPKYGVSELVVQDTDGDNIVDRVDVMVGKRWNSRVTSPPDKSLRVIMLNPDGVSSGYASLRRGTKINETNSEDPWFDGFIAIEFDEQGHCVTSTPVNAFEYQICLNSNCD